MSGQDSENRPRGVGTACFSPKRRPIWTVHNRASGCAGGFYFLGCTGIIGLVD